MTGRVMRWAQRLVLTVFVLSLLIGFLIPVYTDEVAWRYLERAALDGVDKPLNDGCGTFVSPAFFMWPVRAFSAAMGSLFPDPFYIRFSGVAYAILFTGMLVLLIRKAAASARQATLVTTIVFSLMALGMMPWLMVWSRPEQPLLLALLGAMLIAFGQADTPPDQALRRAWRQSAGVLLLSLVALSYHLKGVLLVPAFALCLIYCCRGRQTRLPRFAFGMLMLAAAAFAAQYWIARGRCPGDPILAAQFAGANTLSRIARGDDWRDIVPLLLSHADPMSYVWLIGPKDHPMSTWLQAGQITPAEMRSWLTILVLCWKPVLYFSLLLLALLGFRRLRHRRIGIDLALPVMLFGIATLWAATQLLPNVYESLFGIPLLAMVIALALASPAVEQHWLKWGEWLAIPLAMVAIASPIRMTMLYGPSLWSAAQQEAYIAGQRYSQPVFGYAGARPAIAETARQCGIPDNRRLHGLLVDDTTYFAFIGSYRPEHWLGTLSVWNGSITDPIAHLRKIGSDGMVVGCHLLSDDLRRRAHGNGAFCCMGPNRW